MFIVSYNNSFRVVRSLPMRCSASAMFVSSNVDSCQARIRRSIYSLRCRLDVSSNLITHSVIHSDVHVASKLNNMLISTLYNLAALRQAALLVICVIFTCSALYVCIVFSMDPLRSEIKLYYYLLLLSLLLI